MCDLFAITSRRYSADVECDGFDDLLPEFGIFSHIFSLQLELLLLVHVIASKRVDFADNVHKYAFGASVARLAVLGWVADVAASDIGAAVGGERDAI